MCMPDKEEYSYRFWKISEAFLLELKKECPIESKWNKKIKGYVACVSLNTREMCIPLSKFLSNHDLSSVDHGVYISLVTDSDQAGFTVPDYILQLLRDYKGTLDVSFIIV